MDNPTIATYEKYAKIYDQEVIEFWENFPSTFIKRFTAELPGKRVLDLGSGSGRDASKLREYDLDVICVDASQKMTEITESLGFKSIHATFDEYDYAANSFDGVWAYTSLIHIPKSEAKKVIQNIHKSLTPDGLFGIGVIEGDTASMIERENMPGSARYFKKYQRNELRQLLESCGFKFLYEEDYRPHNNIYLNQIYKK